MSAESEELELLRAAEYAAIEPWALLQAVRAADGRIVDFTYHDINPVGASHQNRSRDELIGRSVAETLPEVARIGLIDQYAHCVETGEPLILDDLSYTGHTLDTEGVEVRRYDLRGVRVGVDYLSLTWRDVNRRYLTHHEIAESEERYRHLAENSWDVVAHVRDGVLVWVSLSAEEPSGAPARHWLGRKVQDLTPVEDWPVVAEMAREISTGATSRRRLRLFDASGVVHWVDMRGRAFHDSHGRRDGETVSMRVIDDEIAIEQELEEARRRQSEADAIYRRSMESAAVGMCLARVDGTFLDVNAAMCDFFGYDTETLMAKTWIELTAPDHLEADLINVRDLVAGRSESYRMVKQYIHADGRLIWGDLSVGCVRNADGSINTLVAQVTDITDEVQTREQLDHAQAELSDALKQSEVAQALTRAASDSLLDPQVLLEAMRDASGRIVDFVYREINRATSEYLGVPPEQLLGRGIVELMPGIKAELLEGYIRCLLTGEPLILNDFSYDNEVLRDTRRYDIRATRATADAISLTWRDVTDRFAVAQQLAESEEQFRLLAANAGDTVIRVRDGICVWVSPMIAETLGAPPAYWVGRELTELIVPGQEQAYRDRLASLATGQTIQTRVKLRAADGSLHWAHLRANPFYNAEGDIDGVVGAFRLIDDEVAAEEELAAARLEQARADARYRRLFSSTAVGTCLISPEGRYIEVNSAACDFFGYDAETLMRKSWQELTAPDYLGADLSRLNDLLEGRIDTYRVLKQYIHAGGDRIWGDLAMSCIRDDRGEVEQLIAQISDVTEAVAASEQVARLNKRLSEEMQSAAAYVESVLPGDLQGPVEVTSRYLPALDLSGDCFHWRWLDDDHLKIYLVDVSGHGVRSALLSMSLHNLIRSGSLSMETLKDPIAVMNILNESFSMDDQAESYFTLWYGIYKNSTRTITYVNAGHPPALLYQPGEREPVELSATSLPVGMFGDTQFQSATAAVPPGSQLLLFSDGAFELSSDHESLKEFIEICNDLSGSPDPWLDALIGRLRPLTADDAFEDDCSLILSRFE